MGEDEWLRTNRFPDAVELLALAQARSFISVLSQQLNLKKGSGEIVTTTTITLEHSPAGWKGLRTHLNVTAKLFRVSQAKFIDATIRAKTECVVSRMLRGTLTMTAKLEMLIPRVLSEKTV